MLTFLKEKYYIFLIVIFILIISVIGFGYLEIKNLKNKILNIENQLYKNQNDFEKKQQTIEKKIIEKQIPIFGICLGNQILALASGADTYKLKFGHRSQNQPCMDLKTKKCFITSQNHGYAVDTKTLKVGWTEWFKNINDDTNEGIIHDSGLFFSVQFHPEANPGPIDTNYLFEYFIDNIKKNKFSQNLDFNSKTFIEVEKNAK